MGVEYSVDLLYGIILKEDDLTVIAGEIRPTYVDWSDWDERDEVMIAALSRVDGNIGRLLAFDVIDQEESQNVQIVVYARSSFVSNDAKRGSGDLFDKGFIGANDVRIVPEEREALEKFKELYDSGEEIQMLVLGRVH